MPTKRTPRIPSTTLAGVRVAPQIDITPVAAQALDLYLSTAIPDAIRKRDEILPRVRKWRQTIAGKRPRQLSRRGASNLSVPLTIWARVAVRARITESLIESTPILSVEPVPGRDPIESRESSQTTAKAIGTFLTSQILSARALDGRNTVNKLAAEIVDLGTSAMKVVPRLDSVKKIGPTMTDPGAKPRLVPLPGDVRWEHISYLNLLYTDGYGTNTQEMPFIGHQFKQAWSEISTFASLGHYDRTVVEQIHGAAAASENQKPEALQNHDLSELYMDWDVDGDGIQEAILVTWHNTARKRLRTVWNPYPDGRRPVLIAQFDLPGDITNVAGQGVSEKLEGPQDEVDAIHNIAIEAGKRGVAHILVVREGTRAEEEFGGDTDVLPGDIVITSTPDEDVKPIPLGDPNAALAAIQIEEHTRMYVTRILGLDESRVGNVESGKRVTAAVGMATMREGRMIIKAALTSLADLLSEASYLTLDLYKQQVPVEAIRTALDPESAQALINTVFSLTASTARNAFLIRVNAQDAAIIQDNKKQEMLIINNALFPFYDRMMQAVIQIADPNLPPAAKRGLTLIVERMERGIEALLNTVESIPNPSELLVRIGELQQVLEQSGAPALADPGDEETAADSLVGDLGAGIS
jgi:hypothetical protein